MKSEIREFIKSTLVEMHRTCTTDKYGQVHQSKFTPELFGDRKDEVRQYCRDNENVLQYATYGGSYGTYTGFTVQCPEIRKECSAALGSNPNYLRNLNSW